MVGAAHALAQLDAGADPELGERIAQMGSHGVRGKVQLCGDVAVGRARRDEVDDRELGVGEAVPARFCPRSADNATVHTQPAQRATHPARIGERFVVHVGVECGIELIQRLVRAIGVGELAAGVLGSRGVQKRPRRRLKHVCGSQQCWERHVRVSRAHA